jgi:hypothetical protein
MVSRPGTKENKFAPGLTKDRLAPELCLEEHETDGPSGCQIWTKPTSDNGSRGIEERTFVFAPTRRGCQKFLTGADRRLISCLGSQVTIFSASCWSSEAFSSGMTTEKSGAALAVAPVQLTTAENDCGRVGCRLDEDARCLVRMRRRRLEVAAHCRLPCRRHGSGLGKCEGLRRFDHRIRRHFRPRPRKANLWSAEADAGKKREICGASDGESRLLHLATLKISSWSKACHELTWATSFMQINAMGKFSGPESRRLTAGMGTTGIAADLQQSGWRQLEKAVELRAGPKCRSMLYFVLERIHASPENGGWRSKNSDFVYENPLNEKTKGLTP